MHSFLNLAVCRKLIKEVLFFASCMTCVYMLLLRILRFLAFVVLFQSLFWLRLNDKLCVPGHLCGAISCCPTHLTRVVRFPPYTKIFPSS